MKKVYYKHVIIKTGDQDDVEKEINSFSGVTTISLNVIPERVGVENVQGFSLPIYWYHISLAYTSNEE